MQGAAYGGGVGFVAACDLAYALPSARFALTEVRLGLIPAVIALFLLGKMVLGPFAPWALRCQHRRRLSLGFGAGAFGGDEVGLDLAINATIDRIRRAAPKRDCGLESFCCDSSVTLIQPR